LVVNAFTLSNVPIGSKLANTNGTLLRRDPRVRPRLPPLLARSTQYALMIAPNHVALRTALVEALSRIRQDAQYAAIHRRWFGVPTHPA
jgi:hypothetical protein